MSSFRSLKQARSRQGGRAYDVDVTKGECKIRKEDCSLARVSSREKRVISREPSFVYSSGKPCEQVNLIYFDLNGAFVSIPGMFK